MTGKWNKIEDRSSIAPEIHGYFVGGILVGSYNDFHNVYQVSIYEYRTYKIHNSVIVNTITTARKFIEENYVKE